MANSLTDDAPYVAVFLPGGHGAMLGLPGNADLGELLRWAHGRRGDVFTLAICHGPAALLAAAVDQQGGDSMGLKKSINIYGEFCSILWAGFQSHLGQKNNAIESAPCRARTSSTLDTGSPPARTPWTRRPR